MKLVYLLSAIVLLLSCSKDPAPLTNSEIILGDWNLESKFEYNDKDSGELLDEKKYYYEATFLENGKFERINYNSFGTAFIDSFEWHFIETTPPLRLYDKMFYQDNEYEDLNAGSRIVDTLSSDLFIVSKPFSFYLDDGSLSPTGVWTYIYTR